MKEKERLTKLDKQMWYLTQLNKLLQFHRDLGFDEKELLAYIARQLGFGIKKRRKGWFNVIQA